MKKIKTEVEKKTKDVRKTKVVGRVGEEVVIPK